MKPKYLFIDDESGGATDALLHGFNDTKLISVRQLSIDKNDCFESISDKIISEYRANCFDGIIVDLCLDGEGENSMNFKAPSLAQQIRTRSSEGAFPLFPIVLCSTMEKVDSFYMKDRASHDLFDLYFNKDAAAKVSARLASLAEGYRLLNSDKRSVLDVLGRPDSEILDTRIIDYLSNGSLSSFDVACFVLKNLFLFSGLLIDETIVASRLGVDLKLSEGWSRLEDALNDCRYRGVFCGGWKRFWADKIDDFFVKLSGGTPYQFLPALERVEILAKNGFDGIIPAKPIEYNHSSVFDTVCVCSNRPMDSMEGIPVEDSLDLKPWQEHHYVSFFAVASGDYPAAKLGGEGIKLFNEKREAIRNGEA